MFTTGILLFIVIGLILLAMLAFEVWMFVDAINNSHITDTERILWCVGMLLIHPIVAIVYYFTARNKPAL